jgi:catalase (peroxidase I)
VRADVLDLIKSSVDFWPSDFPDSPSGGTYAGLFIRQVGA